MGKEPPFAGDGGFPEQYRPVQGPGGDPAAAGGQRQGARVRGRQSLGVGTTAAEWSRHAPGGLELSLVWRPGQPLMSGWSRDAAGTVTF